MEIDNNLKKALEYLMIELNVRQEIKKDFFLLIKACDYANMDNWVDNPISKEQEIKKRIFLIKATSFFQRKKLEYQSEKNIEIRKRIDAIRKIEYTNEKMLLLTMGIASNS